MLKSVGILVAIIFILFIFWMNLTPGYFQRDCVGVSYQRQGYHCSILPLPNKYNRLLNSILIFLSDFDINK